MKRIQSTIISMLVLLMLSSCGRFSGWISFINNSDQAIVVNETSGFVRSGSEFVSGINFDSCNYDFCPTLENNFHFVEKNFDVILLKVGSFVSSSFSVLFSSITTFVLNFVIFILSFFFLLKDGGRFIVYLKRIVPMKNSYKEALFLRFRDVTEAVFLDSIFIAFCRTRGLVVLL